MMEPREQLMLCWTTENAKNYPPLPLTGQKMEEGREGKGLNGLFLFPPPSYRGSIFVVPRAVPHTSFFANYFFRDTSPQHHRRYSFFLPRCHGDICGSTDMENKINWEPYFPILRKCTWKLYIQRRNICHETFIFSSIFPHDGETNLSNPLLRKDPFS